MLLLPLDKLFGTFHDGSLEAHEAMKNRRRESAEASDSAPVDLTRQSPADLG